VLGKVMDHIRPFLPGAAEPQHARA
jgi:hypothetical protein